MIGRLRLRALAASLLVVVVLELLAAEEDAWEFTERFWEKKVAD